MIIIHLGGDFTDDQISQTKLLAGRKFSEDVIVAPGHVRLNVIDPVSLQIAGLIVSVIALCVSIATRKAKVDEDNLWTGDRLKAIIETEMFEQNVVDYEVESVENFRALVESTGGKCRVAVRSAKTKTVLTLFVSKNGDAFTIHKQETSLVE